MVSMKAKSKPDKAAAPAAPIPCGGDRALVAPDANGRSHEFSYWDVWFAVVIQQNFAGDFEKLARHFKTGQKGFSLNEFKAKEKLSHLRDLQHRLLNANLPVSALIDCDPALAVRERRRARGRVLKHKLTLNSASPVSAGRSMNSKHGIWIIKARKR